jgi:primosomal protein N' (replication factor Y)
MCYDCNWLAECKRCDARLTFHQQNNTLVCHHCLFTRPVPKICEQCKSSSLHPVGLGTQKIEEVLKDQFKEASIARIDSDMTRKKGHLEEILEKATKNEINLLIGTQILAKGHHFPKLHLVAIVDADGGLFSADFRGLERMAQLIIQVAGRAGRVIEAGNVLVQTCHPEHPLLKHILSQNYQQFAEEVLQVRQSCELPPFSHFALLRTTSKQPHLGEKLLQDVGAALSKMHIPTVKILGPIPAPMAKRQGDFRFQLLLQSSLRKPLHDVLNYCVHFLEKAKNARAVKWSLDVDPQEMM